MIARNRMIFMIAEEVNSVLMKRLYSWASRYVVTHKTKISQSNNIMKDLPVPYAAPSVSLLSSPFLFIATFCNYTSRLYVCLSKRREVRGHITEACNVYVLSG